MKILVTGFEPFNGETVNPSEQIVYRLEAPEGVCLIKEILPVEFKKSTARLKELFQKYQPDVVLSVGQAGGRAEISLFYANKSSENISNVIYTVIKYMVSPKQYMYNIETNRKWLK